MFDALKFQAVSGCWVCDCVCVPLRCLSRCGLHVTVNPEYVPGYVPLRNPDSCILETVVYLSASW